MACYNPRQAVEVTGLKTINGKKVIRFLKEEEGTIQDNIEKIKDGKIMTLPCGRCIGCRLDHARHWADRMILELDRMKKSVFVTLTYADDYLPAREEDVSCYGEVRHALNDRAAPLSPLVKDHMPEFMKRLRADLNYKKNIRKYMEEWPELINWQNEKDGKPMVKVRFYGCGEYGEIYGRCHLHIIIFGLSLADLAYLQQTPLKPVKKNELGQVTFESEYLEKFWKKGFVNISESNYLTMGYVARYTMKKAKGNSYPEKYDLPPEFVLMSRNPGIGGYFIEDHPGKIDEVSTWYVQGKEIYWPSYLVRKQHEVWNEELKCYELDEEGQKMQEARRQLALDKFVNTFVYDDRPYYQKQEFLRMQKESSVKKLIRGDVTLD